MGEGRQVARAITSLFVCTPTHSGRLLPLSFARQWPVLRTQNEPLSAPSLPISSKCPSPRPKKRSSRPCPRHAKRGTPRRRTGSKPGGLSPNVCLLLSFLRANADMRADNLPAPAALLASTSVAGSASDLRGLAQPYSLAFTNFVASLPSSPSSSALHDHSFGSLPPFPRRRHSLRHTAARGLLDVRTTFVVFFSNSGADACTIFRFVVVVM